MTLPNFLIIGAAKAGTTTLYDHFRAHPDIFMPLVKEPKFFSHDGGERRRGVSITTLEDYEALFAEVTTETAIGEASTQYLGDPQSPERIHDLLPEARLIASLRDPVARARSVYEMNRRDRGAHAGVPFARALEHDPALRQGYADKLARYFALFPRERIRIILLEDLEAAPRETLRGLYGFLGVDPGFEPDLSRVSNPGGAPRSKLLHGLLSDPKLRALGRAALPPSLTERLKSLRARNLKKTGLVPEDRAAALAVFRDDIERTEALIGRDLSAWLRG